VKKPPANTAALIIKTEEDEMNGYFLTIFMGVALAFNGCATATRTAASQDGGRKTPQYLNQDFSALGGVVPLEKGIKVTISGDLVFKTRQSKPSAYGVQKMDAVAAVLMKYPAARTTIRVYTDGRGSHAWNLAISKKRAKAFRDELVKQGVPAETLAAVGMGAANPVAANDTPGGKARNRRIELIIVLP
jgi:outer membrane protein OmpA-like peptidoglycan-associated protein